MVWIWVSLYLSSQSPFHSPSHKPSHCAIVFESTEHKILPIHTRIKMGLETPLFLLVFFLRMRLGKTIYLHFKFQKCYKDCDSQTEMWIHLQYRVRWLREVKLEVYFSPTYLLLILDACYPECCILWMPCCIFSYSECIKKLSILLRALNLISYLAVYKLHTTRYCIFCLLVEFLLLSLPLQDSSVFVQYFVEIIRQDPGGLGGEGWGIGGSEKNPQHNYVINSCVYKKREKMFVFVQQVLTVEFSEVYLTL